MDILNNIDEEWKKFITTKDDYESDSYDDEFEDNINIEDNNIISANLYKDLDLQNLSVNDDENPFKKDIEDFDNLINQNQSLENSGLNNLSGGSLDNSLNDGDSNF
jgi:hypothetical protein